MHLNILSLFSKITSVFSKSFYFKIVFNVYLVSWIKVYFSFNLVNYFLQDYLQIGIFLKIIF